MKKLSLYDIENSSPKELMDYYKMNEQKMEHQLRNHTVDGYREEVRDFYTKFYDRRK